MYSNTLSLSLSLLSQLFWQACDREKNREIERERGLDKLDEIHDEIDRNPTSLMA